MKIGGTFDTVPNASWLPSSFKSTFEILLESLSFLSKNIALIHALLIFHLYEEPPLGSLLQALLTPNHSTTNLTVVSLSVIFLLSQAFQHFLHISFCLQPQLLLTSTFPFLLPSFLSLKYPNTPLKTSLPYIASIPQTYHMVLNFFVFAD